MKVCRENCHFKWINYTNSVRNLSTGNSQKLCIGLDKQGIDYSNREFLSLRVKLNQISNRISRPLFSPANNIVLFYLSTILPIITGVCPFQRLTAVSVTLNTQSVKTTKLWQLNDYIHLNQANKVDWLTGRIRPW